MLVRPYLALLGRNVTQLEESMGLRRNHIRLEAFIWHCDNIVFKFDLRRETNVMVLLYISDRTEVVEL